MKTARRSFGEPYQCKYPWDDNCFVQCGDNGIVISKNIQKCLDSENPIGFIKNNTSYITAFFEAFPNNPKTFIRGKGKSVEEAEKNAWERLQTHLACKSHEFERRGYTNGVGFCKHCGLFKSKIFEPLTRCCICDIPTFYSVDSKDNWYCEDHKKDIPEENKTETHKFMDMF